MKEKITRLRGLSTDVDETNIKLEFSKFINGNIKNEFHQARDYQIVCKDDKPHDFFEEVILDEDKLNISKEGDQFKNNYRYDPKYFYLGISGNTISLYDRYENPEKKLPEVE